MLDTTDNKTKPRRRPTSHDEGRLTDKRNRGRFESLKREAEEWAKNSPDCEQTRRHIAYTKQINDPTLPEFLMFELPVPGCITQYSKERWREIYGYDLDQAPKVALRDEQGLPVDRDVRRQLRRLAVEQLYGLDFLHSFDGTVCDDKGVPIDRKTRIKMRHFWIKQEFGYNFEKALKDGLSDDQGLPVDRKIRRKMLYKVLEQMRCLAIDWCEKHQRFASEWKQVCLTPPSTESEEAFVQFCLRRFIAILNRNCGAGANTDGAIFETQPDALRMISKWLTLFVKQVEFAVAQPNSKDRFEERSDQFYRLYLAAALADDLKLNKAKSKRKLSEVVWEKATAHILMQNALHRDAGADEIPTKPSPDAVRKFSARFPKSSAGFKALDWRIASYDNVLRLIDDAWARAVIGFDALRSGANPDVIDALQFKKETVQITDLCDDFDEAPSGVFANLIVADTLDAWSKSHDKLQSRLSITRRRISNRPGRHELVCGYDS